MTRKTTSEGGNSHPLAKVLLGVSLLAAVLVWVPILPFSIGLCLPDLSGATGIDEAVPAVGKFLLSVLLGGVVYFVLLYLSHQRQLNSPSYLKVFRMN